MSNTLIGGLLALLGLGLLLDALLPIPIPIFKIIFALIFVYFGVRLLSGRRGVVSQTSWGTSTILGESNERPEPASSGPVAFQYSTCLARNVLDLGQLYAKGVSGRVELNVVLGEQVLRIPKQMPFRLRVQAIFAGVEMPDGPRPGIGTSVFGSGDAQAVEIDVTVVLSGFQIELY